jgi:hypothetical protein
MLKACSSAVAAVAYLCQRAQCQHGEGEDGAVPPPGRLADDSNWQGCSTEINISGFLLNLV